MRTENEGPETWIVVGKPGYQGGNRDAQVEKWERAYGRGNWKLGWQLANGELMSFEQMFEEYVQGYAAYFLSHPEELQYLTENFAYAFDKDPVSKAEAFDPNFLRNKPGRPNQFHHAALNIAVEQRLNQAFRGDLPIQVREGKRDADPATWPLGWRWSPGRIPAVHAELIPEGVQSGWWQAGSVEHLYQATKVLMIKK